MSLPRADAGRIAADVDALRALTVLDRPFTRRAFTPMYVEGRRWLSEAMAGAGLQTQCDAAGNLIASSGQHAESVAIGSHIDTVPDGGAYDGVAGVLAGLEVARLVRAAAIELPFRLEVIDFLSEEPSDFGLSCIEQGRRLEQSGTPLGIVTGIVGIRRYEVRLRGAAAHSGTTPMNYRRDALAGVAELILSVERLARERSLDGEFVGTVGQLAVLPGGANVVPGETTATVELRALEDRTLDEAELELREDARDLAAGRGLELAFDEISRTAPVQLDPDLRALLARAARAAGTDTLELASGGGHDAGHLAAIAPSVMLFIPCRDGVSHAPEEYAEPEHIALGADVLLSVLVELAGRRR